MTVQECMLKAFQEAEQKLGSVKIVAVGITNQRETTVVWNKQTGLPLYNAIVWLDTRTAELCEKMEQELGSKDFFRPVTGLPISTYFSAFKFKWLYDNVEVVKQAVDAGDALFGTMDSWLIYQMTGGARDGVHVTDVTNASRTMLFSLETGQWHEPFLSYFSMPASVLPRICSNAEVYGHVAQPHHPAYQGVPISGCLGDQMAAMLGQRCQAGEAKNTYGTGCFMLLNTGEKPTKRNLQPTAQLVPSTHGLLTTVAFKLGQEEPTQYALEGAIAVAGLGISWLCDNLCVTENPENAEQLAGSVPDTAGVYFVPAFSGLLAPHWDNTARGVILGLTAFSTRAHVVRAMLEAICWQSREVLDAMRRDAELEGLAVLRVDGGASVNNLLMQMQADVLQVPVLRPHFQETTCLGACLAAGLGAGIWNVAHVFAGHSYNNTKFTPAMPTDEAERRYTRWQLAVSRSLQLAQLAAPLTE